MSATYNCNFCNKKLSAHSYIRNAFIYIPKKLHKSLGSYDVKVEFNIQIENSSLDICDECIDEVKIDALKALKKTKTENKY